MSAIPPKEANPNGLHQRYNVTKTNGEPVDPLATYFVLRLDSHGRDWQHIQASRHAAREYARLTVKVPYLRKMAEDLLALVDNLETQNDS